MEKAAKEQGVILFVAESNLGEEDHFLQELLKSSNRYWYLLYKFGRKENEQHKEE